MMREVKLLAVREIQQRGLAKAPLIVTVFMIVLLLGGGAVVGYLHDRGTFDDNSTLAVTAQTRMLGRAVQAGSKALGEQIGGGANYRLITAKDDADGRAKVKSGDADAAIVGKPENLELITKKTAPKTLTLLVQQGTAATTIADYITQHGGIPAELNQKLAKTHVKVTSLKEENDNEEGFTTYLVTVIFLGLLFGAIMATGQSVAMGIVEEKSSRVVEVLLGVTSPTQLLVGKCIGISIASLAQFTCIALAAYGGAKLSKLHFEVDWAAVSLWALVWVLLGMAMYMVLYAAIGAMVSRTEDLGTVLSPLMLIQVAVFYVAIFLPMSNPDSIVLRVMSFIPGMSCYAMPARVGLNAVSAWEQAVAIALNLAVIPLVVKFAGRAYRRGLLATGAKLSFRDAFGNGSKARKSAEGAKN
ncbi:MAG: ABC transporter permease [Actinomycetaceae bacterium]|nr:ABC transporter permease [Actinomycetaceae bacterium]